MTYFAEDLAKRNQNKITIRREKVFTRLCMDLDFGSDPNTMIICMIRYLDQVLKEQPKLLKGHKINPHVDYFFNIRDDIKQEILCEDMAGHFRRTTAQLLFLCLRARPDIQTAVVFFATRVREPDMDDW